MERSVRERGFVLFCVHAHVLTLLVCDTIDKQMNEDPVGGSP